MDSYNFKEIEPKWQNVWDKGNFYRASEDASKEKHYVLEMFPYPSGVLHMGHVRNYAIGDVIARYKRACGYNVLHPIGWDSFGLPAENAAIKHHVSPQVWTKKNIQIMKEQFKSLGFSYDWSREITSSSPNYYAHEQQIFLDFFKKGLAYQKEAWVNWDPEENTVLANEQVVDGRGWRSGVPVERRLLSQWFLKITSFAEELLENLKKLPNWPERVKVMQENWIGKSHGALIQFPIVKAEKLSIKDLEVFTTCPHTIFGASFIAVSPDHPLSHELSKESKKIASLIEKFHTQGVDQATQDMVEKEGVFTGYYAQHPFLKERQLPIYIANFVIMDYGTGVVFACPAHDERDFDFAIKYDLPIVPVIESPEQADNQKILEKTAAYTGNGVLINSEFLNDLNVEKAKEEAINQFEKLKLGKRKTFYRLRDWGVSRQRYWGCPIPIIHCPKCGPVPVPDEDLPILLPENVSLDKPGNPLDHCQEWINVNCPKCSEPSQRETDTFDTFFESSWYFHRFCSPHDKNAPFDRKQVDYWMSVDDYVGGIEHAVLHLLYARFFTKALKECGYIENSEPFKKLLTQGMVCHHTYQDKNGTWLYPEEVKRIKGDSYVKISDDSPVMVGRSEKMSKSKNNVVDPSVITSEYGVDTARLFSLSDTPPDRNLDWSEEGVQGAWRYINRLWRLVNQSIQLINKNPNSNVECLELTKKTHKYIADITYNFDRSHFNKVLANIRELTNEIQKHVSSGSIDPKALKHAIETLVIVVAPFTPHLASELWEKLGHSSFLDTIPWPKTDKNLIQEEIITLAIQVNGKLRGTLDIKKDAAKEIVTDRALNMDTVQKALSGNKPKKVVLIPNRVVNVVV